MKYEKRIVLFTLFAMNLVDQPAPELMLDQGILSGKISADGSYFEYLGIPYATSNSETRFKAPLPPPKWEGVYKAVDEHYSCPQTIKYLGVVGSEDCLKINVYVPAKPEKTQTLPVMVYIHGGAFFMGSGGKLLYAPEFLLKHDVIIVTFNYRLGALGFLCLGIEDAPGNSGLKDQIAALRWVKKNIAAFGGDTENVTVFGESAGGASTSALLASEVTDGLFNKAIIQSGSSVSNWLINRKPVWVASLLTKELGHHTKNPQEIYEILSRLAYKDLISLNPVKPLGMYYDTHLLHLPCVEKKFSGVEPVLTDLPYNLLKRKPKNISVMYGSNSKEGFFFTATENDTKLQEKNDKYLFASDLKFNSLKETEQVADKVKQFYFGNKRVSLETIMEVVKLYTELYFEIPAILEADITLAYSNATVYNYYFDYSGERNVLKKLTGYGKETGACHADELFYLFDSRLWPFPINGKDRQMIEWMTRMWTNFAKYGDPTPDFTSDLPVRWIPRTKHDQKFLYIQDELKMGPVPNPDAYHLWKGIYNKHRRLDINFY